VKISPLALIVFAPLLGLTFVLFLPLFGIGVLLIVCLLPLLSGLAAVAMTAMRVTTRISGTRTVRHAPLFKTYFTGARTRTGVKQQGPKRGGQQGR
jgi:hypothetical protein